MTDDPRAASAAEAGLAPLLRVGDRLYRSRTGEVVDGDDVRRLRPQAADAFAMLLARPGELVDRRTIIDRLWPHGAIEGDLGLNACVRQIRAAFGDDADQPRFVETLRGRGYRLIAPVSVIDESAVPAGPGAAPTPGPETVRPSARRARALAAVVAIGLFLIAGPTLRETEAPAAGSGPYRMAVLPIGAIESDPELEPYRAALTEDLITELANIHPSELLVVGRTSVETLVQRGLGAPEIARELGLDYVLTGTLRSVPRGRRLTTQLLDVEAGGYVWSSSEDVADEELHRAHHVVSGGVLAALDMDVTPGALALSPPSVRNAVLQARFLRERASRENSRLAVELLTAALGPNPSDPTGLVELGRHQLMLGELDVAEGTLEQARALNPAADGLDHAAGQLALYGRMDVSAAIALLERAIERRPGTSALRHNYAHALVADGRGEDAAEQARIAMGLDPVSSLVLGDMGWVLYYAGALDEAREACRETLLLVPESLSARKCVVLAAARQGELDEVSSDVGILVQELGAGDSERERLTAAAEAGDDAAVWQWVVNRTAGLTPVDRARALALLGRSEEARAIMSGEPVSTFGDLMDRQDPLLHG